MLHARSAADREPYQLNVRTCNCDASVTLPTPDARACIAFDIVPAGRGQAVVVVDVQAGSAAEAAGVRRGMKLTALSDPIRFSEVWRLEDRPSLRYVSETLRMRQAATIDLEFVESDLQLPSSSSSDSLDLGSSASDARVLTRDGPGTIGSALSLLDSLDVDGGTSSGDEGGGAAAPTLGEQLAQNYASSERKLTPVQERIKARQEYQAAMDSRNDGPFLTLVVVAFLAPALVGLAVAYFSGYFEHMLGMQW